jgi:UDP-glucose 4-epimerase
MSRLKLGSTQVLILIDGGKLAAASGQKSLNSRNYCSTSFCNQCHFDIEPFYTASEEHRIDAIAHFAAKIVALESVADPAS